MPQEGGLALYDENLDSLQRRVARLDTGLAWSEDPPSRTRRFISNIEAEPGNTENEILVHSNFLVYKNRAETEGDFFIGKRKDILRRLNGSFKIASRRMVLDQTVILAKNISIFFWGRSDNGFVVAGPESSSPWPRGRGNFLGAAGGAMLLTTFSTVISALRIPEGWRMIVYGSIILLALLAFQEDFRRLRGRIGSALLAMTFGRHK
jgi:Ring hydroxylating beta subunit